MPRQVCIRLLALLAPAAMLVACGNSRTPVPSLTQPTAPQGFRTITDTRAGIAFDAPRNWTLTFQHAPLVSTVTSGSAVVAVWNYGRTGQLPADSGGLEQARTALIASAQVRDRGLRVIGSRVTTIAGAPAIVLEATEQIAGRQRRVRSIHMFASGLEIVIDEYAPPNIFPSVDHAVFSPLRRSLTVVSPSRS